MDWGPTPERVVEGEDVSLSYHLQGPGCGSRTFDGHPVPHSPPPTRTHTPLATSDQSSDPSRFRTPVSSTDTDVPSLTCRGYTPVPVAPRSGPRTSDSENHGLCVLEWGPPFMGVSQRQVDWRGKCWCGRGEAVPFDEEG